MQKLNNDNIDKMIKERLPKCEVSFMLYLSSYQDAYGKVYGVYYKDVCAVTGMSFQEFYNAKKSLEQKGLIRCEKSSRIDHDITILNNTFLTREDEKRGYLNTNHNIFRLKEFYQMKAGAMLLGMKLMELTFKNRACFIIGAKTFYEKYGRMFQVTRRVLRHYLKQLKQFFSIGMKDGKYYIEAKKIIYKKPDGKTEAERLREQRTEAVLRRNRIRHTGEKEIREIHTFFQQYGKAAEEKGKNLFLLMDKAVGDSIEKVYAEGRKKQEHSLRLPLVHKLLREALFGEKETPGELPGQKERGSMGTPGKLLWQKARGSMGMPGKTGKNRFMNFEQRTYDYDELERMLLSSDPENA